MKTLAILIIFLFSLVFSSCENNPENDLNNTDNTIVNKWIFSGIRDKESRVEKYIPDNLKEMSIEFRDDNTFGAISSCNGLGGIYSLSQNDSIKTDSVITTLMYCFNDTVRLWEDTYCKGLKNAVRYHIAGNDLEIETKIDYDMLFTGAVKEK
jgi:heat shock protein HslJ